MKTGPDQGFSPLKGSFAGLWVCGGNLDCHRGLINKAGFSGMRRHQSEPSRSDQIFDYWKDQQSGRRRGTDRL